MFVTPQDSPRAIVVGGGVAGLIAAIRLTQSNPNFHVEIYEKGETLGGRARTTHRDAVQFNQGPHALYLAGAAYRSLKELGVAIRGKQPNPPVQELIRDGRTYKLPLSFTNILFTRGLSFRTKLELLKFLKTLPTLDWSLRQGLTVSDWLVQTFRTQDMRDFVRLLIRLTSYSNHPHRQSAGVAIRQLQAGTAGVLYLDGGWQSLVDQLVEIATAAGVIIHSHANVSQIEIKYGRATGIVLKGGERVAADVVIAATTLEQADQLIPVDYAASIHCRAKSTVPARVACLDVAFTEVPRPRAAFALGLDEPLYLSNHSLSARLADRASVFHAAWYLGEDAEGTAVRPQLEAMLDLVQPGWRKQVTAVRFLPNMIGASAVDDAASGGFVGRPGVAVDDVEGLFVCGDWVGDEGCLVDASAASAEVAAKRAATYLIAEGGSPRLNRSQPLTPVRG
jgi:phytoene dehydrogenase-like protein